MLQQAMQHILLITEERASTSVPQRISKRRTLDPAWRRRMAESRSQSRPAATPVRQTVKQLTTRESFKNRGEWITHAHCRSVDPEELFVKGAAQRKAVAICRHCPVVLQCRADALDNKVEFGGWGGMTERQRRALLRRHPDVTDWHDFFCGRSDAAAAQREAEGQASAPLSRATPRPVFNFAVAGSYPMCLQLPRRERFYGLPGRGFFCL